MSQNQRTQVAIVGGGPAGLLLSQLLTLFTTPIVYLYLDRLQRWISGSKKKEPPQEPRVAPVVAAE